MCLTQISITTHKIAFPCFLVSSGARSADQSCYLPYHQAWSVSMLCFTQWSRWKDRLLRLTACSRQSVLSHTHADTHTCSHTAGQSVLSISRELGVVYSPCPEQHSPPPTSPQIQSIAARSFAAELCVGVCKREMCSTPSPRSSPKLIMQMTVTCITFFSFFFFYNIKCDSRDDKEKKRTIFWRRRPRPDRRMR